jgi:hypothetical protein
MKEYKIITSNALCEIAVEIISAWALFSTDGSRAKTSRSCLLRKPELRTLDSPDVKKRLNEPTNVSGLRLFVTRGMFHLKIKLNLVMLSSPEEGSSPLVGYPFRCYHRNCVGINRVRTQSTNKLSLHESCPQ